MNIPRKKSGRSRLIAMALVFLITVSAVFYFFFTTKGSCLLVRAVVSRYISPVEIDALKAEGCLARLLVFHNAEFGSLKGLPPGAKLKAQRIEVSFFSLNFYSGIKVNVYNGKLLLPWGDSVLFYGNYRNSALEIQVFTGQLSINETFGVFFRNSEMNKVSGSFTGLDIKITGPLRELFLEGVFCIDSAVYKNFWASGCPAKVSVKLANSGSGLQARGKIDISGGVLSGGNTSEINLKESSIVFKGAPGAVSFDLNGTAKVEDTRIDVSLSGTADKPELKLVSQPPFPQERLLLMLATNRKWQAAENALSGGKVPANLAADFLDYFIFSGSAGKFVRDLGIHDLSFKVDGRSTEVGATKDITGSASVSYSLEQQQDNSAPVAYHKFGAQYKITETLSLGAERVSEQKADTSGEDGGQKVNDKVFLKFKTDF
ncbi:MAG: translocation/assembly module TamB domain-containing protein [Candidatus Omnitrophota bacterium]|jgi:hypothetical protein